jgi:hypothetical protein
MFEFTLRDETTHEFPNFSECGVNAMRKTRKIEDETDRVFSLIEEAFGEDSDHIAALDKVKIEDLGEFIKKFTGGLSAKK